MGLNLEMGCELKAVDEDEGIPEQAGLQYNV